MGLTQLWNQTRRLTPCGSFATTTPWRVQPPPSKESRTMPTRGYRKGISDTKQPVTHSIRTHITAAEFAFLQQQCDARSLSLSKLLRTLVTAFVRNQRAELPQPRGVNNAVLRELCRIGNNLNQLTKQANTGIVPIDAASLRVTLADLLAAVRRLG
jgi:hypothetical protein